MNEQIPSPPKLTAESDVRLVETIISKRQMKVFALTENELQQIAVLNGLALAFSSIGSLLLSAAGTIWLTVEFEGTPTPATKVLSSFGIPFGLVLGVIFFILAGYVMYSRRSAVQVIKDESQNPGRLRE